LRRNCCNSHLSVEKDAESTLERYKFYDQCNRAGVNARKIKNEAEKILRLLDEFDYAMVTNGIHSETSLQVRRDIRIMKTAFRKYVSECNGIFTEINGFAISNAERRCWGCTWMDSNK
jgi:hypothetical protein